LLYPNLAALHDYGIGRTCSLNGGVCHAAKAYPHLSDVGGMIDLVGAPCQPDQDHLTDLLDVCELQGDGLAFRDRVERTILGITTGTRQPPPPAAVTLRLDGAPGSFGGKATIRRPAPDGGPDLLTLSLDGAKLSAGTDANSIVVDLAGASEEVRAALDPRTWP